MYVCVYYTYMYMQLITASSVSPHNSSSIYEVVNPKDTTNFIGVNSNNYVRNTIHMEYRADTEGGLARQSILCEVLSVMMCQVHAQWKSVAYTGIIICVIQG